MPFSYYHSKKSHFIFIVYWVLLAYIIAALIFWFISLNRQNHIMAELKMEQLTKQHAYSPAAADEIREIEKRKVRQYIGEGGTFLLMIIAGAIFVYRGMRIQYKFSEVQQNFMMAITHELKTPIAIAKLNLETLQKRKLDEAQHERLIQNALQETNRLNALCNNMLLASQIEGQCYRVTMEETDFSELVKDCVHDFVIRFPQRPIKMEIADEIFIEGDRLLLQMAINNLLDNAIKYSPKESVVTVLLVLNGKRAELSVKDEGKGIAVKERKKVFERFYREEKDKRVKGTGLGLYLTQKIVQQHKARIFVADNIPQGTIFTISFNTYSSQ